MNKVFSYVAIPTEDFERAFKFYSEITGGLLANNPNVPFPMAYFTDAYGDNVGHLFQLPNFKPSADGAIVYMELAKDLNERIRLVVGTDGEPELEFLNAAGKVLQTLPSASSGTK